MIFRRLQSTKQPVADLTGRVTVSRRVGPLSTSFISSCIVSRCRKVVVKNAPPRSPEKTYQDPELHSTEGLAHD